MFPHTRTSQSFVSTLKDFVGPLAVDLCPPIVTTTTTPTTQPTTTTTASTTTTTAATTTTTTATTTTTPVTTTTALGISARTIENPATTIAAQVLGVVITAPDALADTALPRTGAAVGPLLIWAGLALMVGGTLVLGARPRRD